MGNVIVTSNGVAQFSRTQNQPTANATSKSAVAFDGTESSIANSNGNQLFTNAITNLPVGIDTIQFGAVEASSTNYLQGYIRELAIFPSRRLNANLQAMTS